MMDGRDCDRVSDAGDLVLGAGEGFLMLHSVTKLVCS